MANATRLQIGTFSVLVTRKRMKNLYLRVLPQEGICVSAPLRTTDAEISRFVLSRADWIEKQQARHAATTARCTRTCCPAGWLRRSRSSTADTGPALSAMVARQAASMVG